jgi:hypothetical protein
MHLRTVNPLFSRSAAASAGRGFFIKSAANGRRQLLRSIQMYKRCCRSFERLANFNGKASDSDVLHRSVDLELCSPRIGTAMPFRLAPAIFCT